MKTYLCNYLTSTGAGNIVAKENMVIVVENGKIIEISNYNNQKKYENLIDYSHYVVIPSFSDLHSHVAQLEISGIGYELPLDDWFKKVLYPAEERYDNGGYRVTNKKFINKLWENGIMTSSIFGSINPEAIIDLMNQFEVSGLTGHVGKMNADYSGFNVARETTEDSLTATIRVINHAKTLSKRVQAQVQPEFIPTCSSSLMFELSKLAKTEDLVVHTHFSEGKFEYDYIRPRFGDKSYAEILKNHGLIKRNKTLLIHGVASDDKDIDILKDNNCILVHCPTALSDNPSDVNINIPGLIEKGVMVGYGSDIGGSGTFNPFSNMVAMLRYSNILSLQHNNKINFWEVFKILTQNSGSFFGNYGTIEVGQNFSVLVLKDENNKVYGIKERFQRLAYDNDLSCIKYRYHDGQIITKPFDI